MGYNFRTKQEFLKLKKSLELIKGIKEKQIILESPFNEYIDLDQVYDFVIYSIECIRDKHLLTDEDYCSIENFLCIERKSNDGLFGIGRAKSL